MSYFVFIYSVPIAIDILFRRKRLKAFIIWSVISLIVFLVPVVWVDLQYYGKLVIAPLNIVIYNVFTDHGPDLYGVEPLSYYVNNGFLNFNVVFLLACCCLPLVLLVSWILKISSRNTDIPVWLVLLPMYIWIAIFFTRPHKEERFLFPIYPLFALSGAVAVDYIQKFFSSLFTRGRVSNHYTDNTNWISVSVGATFAVLSLSRIMAIYQGYHAPLELFVELNKISSDPKIHTLSSDKPVNVCVGKEWYRFPSNFFLPANNWNLQFIRSEFKGQLPKPFSSHQDATKLIPSDMNDMNKEEISRYINVNKCHYLIDLDLPNETELEPRYSQRRDEWKILASYKFLDGSRSHRLFRAFYIPFLSSVYCTYVDYNLMKSTRTKRKSQQKMDV